MIAPTVGAMRAALGMLTLQRRKVPAPYLAAHDAAIFAVSQVLEVIDEPTGQQFRPTRLAPAPTQLHAGFVATELATMVMR